MFRIMKVSVVVRNIFVYWASTLLYMVSSHDMHPVHREGDICTPGQAYKVECNTCHCTEERNLICSKMECLGEEEMKILKKTETEQKQKVLRKGRNEIAELPKKKCVAGKIYKRGCQRCFCNAKGIALCSNKLCENMGTSIKTPEDLIPRIGEDEFKELATLPHAAAECEPGKTYRIDCNSCMCISNGNLLCSKMFCLSIAEVNRLAAFKLNGQSCSTNISQDCIDCKCTKEHWECLPKDDCTPNTFRRQLHGLPRKNKKNYDINLFSSEKDVKCIPGMIYKRDCNHCYCQRDGTLRCTRRGCLTYRQRKKLAKQVLKLGLDK